MQLSWTHAAAPPAARCILSFLNKVLFVVLVGYNVFNFSHFVFFLKKNICMRRFSRWFLMNANYFPLNNRHVFLLAWVYITWIRYISIRIYYCRCTKDWTKKRRHLLFDCFQILFFEKKKKHCKVAEVTCSPSSCRDDGPSPCKLRYNANCCSCMCVPTCVGCAGVCVHSLIFSLAVLPCRAGVDSSFQYSECPSGGARVEQLFCFPQHTHAHSSCLVFIAFFLGKLCNTVM